MNNELEFIYICQGKKYICGSVDDKLVVYDFESHIIVENIIPLIMNCIIYKSKQILDTLIKSRIKVIAFDFGCTLSQNHLSPYENILEDIVNNPNKYKNFIIGNWNIMIFDTLCDILRKGGIDVVIASNGNREVEYALLKKTFKYKKKKIITQRVVAIYLLCKSVFYGKKIIPYQTLPEFFIFIYSKFNEKMKDTIDIHQNVFFDKLEEIIKPYDSDAKIPKLKDKKDIPDKSIMLEIALIITKNKEKSSIILIDDNEKNIERITKSGYKGIHIKPSACENHGFIHTFNIINKMKN